MKNHPLLTSNNVKTLKSLKFNYKTLILYMSPFTDNSKGINVCSHASKGCAEACLSKSGFGGMFQTVKDGRRERTEYFLRDRKGFLFQIKDEIERAIKKNNGEYKLAVRLNGTSDIPYEKFRVFEGNKNIFELFPKIKFYDYSKNHFRFEKELPKNYHLTFSRSETNHEKAMELLSKGVSVAMVFDKTPKVYNGFKVVDGDESDLTFTYPKGSIVGLRYKKITTKGADNSLVFKSGFGIRIGEPIKKIEEKLKKVYRKVSKSLVVSK